MNLKKFVSKLKAAKDLDGIGMTFDKDDSIKELVIKHGQTNIEIKLPVAAIEKSDWEALYDVLIGKREPSVLQHMTRVVGYYSKVENWNPSKIGELKDRQAGNYGLKCNL